MIKTPAETSNAFASIVRQKPPVILQVLPALNAGGVEQGVIDLNAAITRAGGKSIVVSSGGKRSYEITRGGGTHIDLPVHSKNPFIMAANVGRLRKIIRDNGVDVVHACSRAPAWSARRAVEGTSARFMTSCHAAHKVTGAFKRLYNSAIASGERVIAVSDFLLEYLVENYKTDRARIRVIHRGVALERFHPNSVSPERLIKVSQAFRLPEGAPIILLPGRLSRIKGHMYLLDAIAALGRKDVFCLFVGSDIGNENYRRELEEYIDSKDLGAQTRIVTTCDDMPAAYMLSAVVVCPSLVPEGFGRVPVEAQAMGRPVIATDHGAVRETIVRAETGWLVPPGDVTALTAALDDALSLDARGRAMLATRAMAHVAANFTNEKMCAATLDVYAELITSAAQAANDASAVPVAASRVAGL